MFLYFHNHTHAHTHTRTPTVVYFDSITLSCCLYLYLLEHQIWINQLLGNSPNCTSYFLFEWLSLKAVFICLRKLLSLLNFFFFLFFPFFFTDLHFQSCHFTQLHYTPNRMLSVSETVSSTENALFGFGEDWCLSRASRVRKKRQSPVTIQANW